MDTIPPSLSPLRFPALILAFAISNVTFAANPVPLELEGKITLGEVRGRIDHLAADLRRQRLFVAELGNDSIGVVDTKENRLLQQIDGLKEPQGLGYVSTGDMLLAANAGDGSVRLFRGESYAAAGRIELRDDADNIRVDPRSHEVYVGYGNGALAQIDPAKFVIIQTISLKGHPEGFQLDDTGQRAFVNVPDRHEIAVVDRKQGEVIASLPTNGARSNFPMAFDPAGGRIFVVFRSPTRLAAYSAKEGLEKARIDTCGDSDDVFFDRKRERVYVSCGEGFVDVFQTSFQGGETSFSRIARIRTVSGARTSLFVADWDRFYLAVRETMSEAAAIWVFRPSP